MKGGPQNFLSRLYSELNNTQLPKFEVINPTANSAAKIKQSEILTIARLDGSYYYKMTFNNFYNFIRLRHPKYSRFFKWITFIPFREPLLLTICANLYLNRHSKALQSSCDGVVFQSEFSFKMQQKFISGKFSKRPYAIIRNGVPTSVFNANVPPKELEGSPKLVITASFRLHKRLQDAIKITTLLKAEFPNIKLHVLGNLDVLTTELINTMNLNSDIIFHGRVESEELPSMYTACDVGLSPSLFDPCPNSVVEMLGCGLPVLTTSESGAAELVKHKDMILKEDVELKYHEVHTAEKIPSVDYSQWASAIRRILKNKQYYKEKALERISEELDIKIAAQKYADFIREVNDQH